MKLKKATRLQTKQHNQRLILKTIFDEGQISRADIARATGLTRTTVSSAVADLIDDHLVEEVGQAPSGGGKPPTLLRVIPNGRHIIGLDLSGDPIQGGVYNLRGMTIHHVTAPLTAQTGEGVLKLVYRLIDELVDAADAPLLGIGLGTPGLIDVHHGRVNVAVHLNWRDMPIRTLLETRYDLPVYLANDSQAAAMAQYMYDNDERDQNLILIKAGQGISAGVVLNGRLYKGGLNSGASEIGHVRVVENGDLCVCGHTGCLETVAGNRAVARWGRIVAQNDPYSLLNGRRPDHIDHEAVLDAYHKGDESLQPMVEQIGRNLGIAAAHLFTAFNIPRLVLAGDVALFGPALIPAMTTELQQRILPALAEQVQVQLSHLETEIVTAGAATLLLANELGVT